MHAFGNKWQTGAFASSAVSGREASGILSSWHSPWIMSVCRGGGREGERGRSCVQRERCRLLDLVSSRFPLTHNRQEALCSTTMETGWNNKAQIALLCVYGVFLKSIFLSPAVFRVFSSTFIPFWGACVIRLSSNFAAASIPLFQCPFWSVSWRNGDDIFSKTICT